MAYKTCPDCGERVYKLGCTNCDEEVYIQQQEWLTDLYGEIDRQHRDALDAFFADTFGPNAAEDEQA